ncbi:beta-ketoacyl synthase chain length factor [Chitinilyticum piscinae]|uniref:Beta-ketoacyl synthase chain length factor n=1 Tax=Chitinilyticum piscinae TaxID=2866724 RepID=A0A8J7K7C5_9NEIS|nr:beta-ketoacyl synthase chain length factor [Chitinilyticum piscinae]MBE9607828.1 beta-ketoacyl synthase chain length factor [Chitinilyticum piscinae]
MTPPPAWSLAVRVDASACWCAHRDGKPALGFVPAMARRRLSALARGCLHVAQQVQDEGDRARLIFGSRHGEIAKTLGMLQEIAAGEPISPAAFSHSVHNAIPGLWSILTGFTGECSAVAAGMDTLPMALLEAQGMLHDDPSTPVVVVIADEAFPEMLHSEAVEPGEGYALALRLSGGAPNLQLQPRSAAQVAADPDLVLSWWSWWLQRHKALVLPGERHDWLWNAA